MIESLQKDCLLYRSLDAKYKTGRNSPLHHDNRCARCIKINPSIPTR